jgi:hypothetical protein
MSPPRRHPALDAWGEYDRDDPFPLFAQVRVAGPVHEARLADGHAAWRVVGHEEARAALANPRSRRTCTWRRRAARRSSRTAFPGLRWPATCWSSTTRPHPAAAAGLARLQQAAGRRAGEQGYQTAKGANPLSPERAQSGMFVGGHPTQDSIGGDRVDRLRRALFTRRTPLDPRGDALGR